MLKDYLPPFLTSNKTLYGVVSKGIHELSEKDCILYFPVVRDCIFMILDQWEEMRKKEAKEKEVQKKRERERRMQEALLTIKKKYGKNAVLRGMNFEEGATAKERNGQIGGHQA